MGVIILPLFLVIAWILAAVGVSGPGTESGAGFVDDAMAWVLFLPVGCIFISSSIMHTVLAKNTAKNIGWQTNGFQYEIGFVSLGLGIAGVLAPYLDPDTWLIVTIPTTTFLVLAGVNHIVEMVRKHNYAPGNTVILVSNFGTPISLWILLFLTGTI